MLVNKQEYYAIGIMSGSSLDGLDIAYCKFTKGAEWQFEIIKAATYSLGSWVQKLKEAVQFNDEQLKELSTKFGQFLAQQTQNFIADKQIKEIDAVVSHGHTIYHYPEKGITCQIGDGQTMADILKIPVINNLRQADIDKGGQGAPIVPIGDLLLFSDFTFCLNLGGIANISAKTNTGIVAFDICTANQVLNHYANKRGFDYDNEGKLAQMGQVNTDLLKKLNDLDYYKKPYPKSLDNGFTSTIIQIIDSFELSVEDILATYCHHIAYQINRSIESINGFNKAASSMLITGGGAFNTFLVKQIEDACGIPCVVPNENIINFKEALVMAFIGVLRLRNEVNVLASVTGSKEDSCCGDLWKS